MMNRDDLAALHAAATKGPWEAHQGIVANSPTVWDITSKHNWRNHGETPEGWFVATVHEVSTEEGAKIDAALIAYLRNHVPDILALIDEHARLREIIYLYVDPSDVRPEHEEAVLANAVRAALSPNSEGEQP